METSNLESVETFGQLHVVANNAGIGTRARSASILILYINPQTASGASSYPSSRDQEFVKCDGYLLIPQRLVRAECRTTRTNKLSRR